MNKFTQYAMECYYNYINDHPNSNLRIEIWSDLLYVNVIGHPIEIEEFYSYCL